MKTRKPISLKATANQMEKELKKAKEIIGYICICYLKSLTSSIFLRENIFYFSMMKGPKTCCNKQHYKTGFPAVFSFGTVCSSSICFLD